MDNPKEELRQTIISAIMEFEGKTKVKIETLLLSKRSEAVYPDTEMFTMKITA